MSFDVPGLVWEADPSVNHRLPSGPATSPNGSRPGTENSVMRLSGTTGGTVGPVGMGPGGTAGPSPPPGGAGSVVDVTADVDVVPSGEDPGPSADTTDPPSGPSTSPTD